MNFKNRMDIHDIQAHRDFNFKVKNVIKSKSVITMSFIIVVVVVLFLFLRKNPEDLIIGEWKIENSTHTIEFTKSGQVIIPNSYGAEFTYEMLGKNRILIHVSILWSNGDVKADIDVNKNTLTLSNFNDPQNIDIFSLGEDKEITFYRKN